jgi:hypothetical protein
MILARLFLATEMPVVDRALEMAAPQEARHKLLDKLRPHRALFALARLLGRGAAREVLLEQDSRIPTTPNPS